MRLKGLRQARRAADLTQLQLGDKVGMNWARIGSIETFRVNPHEYEISKLCDALKLTREELINGKES